MSSLILTGDAISDLESITTRCLKGLIKYNRIIVPRNLMKKILYMSLRGQHCPSSHLDISQRHSLFEYLKDKPDVDCYIKSFLEESEEIVKWME